MSSYIESAYVIENNRLKKIVMNCEQELNQAISQLKIKWSETGADRNIFQTSLYQGRSVYKKMEQDSSEKDREERENLENKTEQLYLDCRNIRDREILVQLEKVRQYLSDENTAVSTIETMLKQIEIQLMQKKKNVQMDVQKSSIGEFRRFENAGKRKKGISIYENRKKNIRDEYVNVRVTFENKLNEAKEFEEIKNKVSDIEQKYYEQPEFAKELYAQQVLSDLDELIQKEKISLSTENNHMKLVLKYNALKEVLIKNRILEKNDTTEEGNIASDAALEFQCKKLEELFLERKSREYVISSLKKVMQKHEISFMEESDTPGVQYSQYDENIDFNISGLTQNKFIIEVEGKYAGTGPTLNEKRKSAASAKKVCGIFKVIHEELERDYGIIFSDVNVMEPSEQTIIMKPLSEKNVENNHLINNEKKVMKCE